MVSSISSSLESNKSAIIQIRGIRIFWVKQFVTIRLNSQEM
jgi:hypothetical protein